MHLIHLIGLEFIYFKGLIGWITLLSFQVEDIQINGHIFKCEFHWTVTTVDQSIGGCKEWLTQDYRNLATRVCHRFSVKNDEFHRKNELTNLNENVFDLSLEIFIELSAN